MNDKPIWESEKRKRSQKALCIDCEYTRQLTPGLEKYDQPLSAAQSSITLCQVVTYMKAYYVSTLTVNAIDFAPESFVACAFMQYTNQLFVCHNQRGVRNK